MGVCGAQARVDTPTSDQAGQAMKLKNVAIQAAKAGAKPYKLADGGGLFLLVNPNGSKLWRLKYRYTGKEKLLAIGSYPDVPLIDAREARDKARKFLAAGVDPGQHKRSEKARARTAATNSFEAVAREWLAMKADEMAPVTHNKARWVLESFAFPHIGSRPLSEIEPPDVLAALRKVEADGKLETLHRLKGRISEVFRFAIADGRATSDPTRDLRGAIKPKRPVKHHASLTDPKAVGDLLRAMDGYSGTAETCAALKLAPLLFVRPGELRTAEWPQFELDGPAPAWRFFVNKTKTHHIVPLSAQAVEILANLKPLTGNGAAGRPGAPCYVFPSVRTRARPMSENTVNYALRGLGYTGEQITGHGFRAMARTLLAEMGWKPDAIERQLAHKASGPLGAAYDRAQFLDERRKMMQAWADYLDGLKRGNIVAGNFGRAA